MTTIKIDLSERHQRIEGFGASGAWWAQEVGGWPDERRETVAGLLFDKRAGIGLSVYRYNIGGGAGAEINDPWRRSETFATGTGGYDWSRDANALWFLRKAHEYGIDRLVAFANSPPAHMTISGYASGGLQGESNLRPDMIRPFAEYLVEIVRHLRENEGIPIGWISPINEPQWAWQPKKGQEGCHYSPEQCLQVVRALLRELKESGLSDDVKVSAVEAGEWKDAGQYVDAILGDPETGGALDTFAIHSYWSDAASKSSLAGYMNEAYPNVRRWMTEWTEMKRGRDYGMESALKLAGVLHEDLTLARVTSWQYWIAVSKYDYRDGLIYADPHNETIEETKRLWAFGQFSRFIRPGAVRLGVEAEEGLKVMAFEEEGGGRLVVTVIHEGDKELISAVRIISDFQPQSLSIHTTSEEHNLKETYRGRPLPEIAMSPRSVTTLVYDR